MFYKFYLFLFFVLCTEIFISNDINILYRRNRKDISQILEIEIYNDYK